MKLIIPVIIVSIAALAIGAGYMYLRPVPPEVRTATGDMTLTASPTVYLPPKTVQQVIAKDEQAHTQLTLTVTSPIHGSTVKSASLSVKGKTAPGAEVFANETEGTADSAGNFTLRITLDEGENPIVVTANDSNGNIAQQDMTITYDAGI